MAQIDYFSCAPVEVGLHVCTELDEWWLAVGKGSMGEGGDDAIVIKAAKPPTATEASYIATGFKWGPGRFHSFTAFPSETTTALPGCRSAKLGPFNASSPSCSAVLFPNKDAWCLESVCGKCAGWPHCSSPPPPPDPGYGGTSGTIIHAQQVNTLSCSYW